MKYSYIYSGLQAAFVFSGIAVLPTGTPTLVDEEAHKKLTKNKFAKHLIDIGELEVQEIAEDEPKTAGKTGGRGGKGGKQNDAAGEQQKPTDEDALAAVKAELTALEVTFSDDETLEQLQAKLAQAKE
ncbi:MULTISPECIES: hypothetical protein [Acinetobacter calcoaceticus/baumannii complex]|uniref:Uncharacterized protein n=1 Tax=Acinetobacter baumannii 625974 TaxID=1310607 RepID=A0A009PCS4_ACIBA|nr:MULTISPECIES: hypothetical protein [Acinetobacter calcoaceticus/baumannii complex]EIB7123157.1 hypothetical protein [Acinetobacter baumannii]ENW11462.1 hypothetical protein F930_01409 [Acinetobacter pittii ANC 3678]EXC05812.1 hypothetical protein J506_2997 [Acinetobacter baumannii 625974]KQK45869.1 hypothetical protein AQ482_12160 [Acinetobacter baumannii]MBD8885164.1 hypothetical protein [Acinetobacter baumannii]